LRRIERVIRRYRMFEGARRIGVAVSGGADSVCLLHILLELAPRYGISLAVLHVDHGLRGDESTGDADFVRALAGRLGLALFCQKLDFGESGGNLEQAARHGRLAFFAECRAKADLDRVATGHTRSDQAETVLFRILRGAAGAGLAGIRPVTADGLVRPLLAVDRQDVLEYLRSRHLEWREDGSNQSRDFARNRIRLSLLPQLAQEWNPAIRETLANMADWAFEEEAWQSVEIQRLAADHLTCEGGRGLIRAGVLASLPRAVARRLVRHVIERVKGDLRSVNFDHVEAVLDLSTEPKGGTACLPGLIVQRSFDWVCFAHSPGRGEWEVMAQVPGTIAIPGTKLSVSLEIVDNSETSGSSYYVYNNEMGCLDWNRLPGSTRLRSWHHGDRYQPKGSAGEIKIKDLFQQARVPVWERQGWPVLESGERIVWSRQFGAAAWCAAGPETRLILRVSEAGQ